MELADNVMVQLRTEPLFNEIVTSLSLDCHVTMNAAPIALHAGARVVARRWPEVTPQQECRDCSNKFGDDKTWRIGRPYAGKGIGQRPRNRDGWVRKRCRCRKPVGRADPRRDDPRCVFAAAVTKDDKD
ncbi:MAG: hypothetical protein R3E77_15005 [Steroidobacteraceae bacterium]